MFSVLLFLVCLGIALVYSCIFVFKCTTFLAEYMMCNRATYITIHITSATQVQPYIVNCIYVIPILTLNVTTEN